MLYLISPAKSLDFDTPVGDVPHTLPQFVAQSSALIHVLKKKSPQQIASLMNLSDALSALNGRIFLAARSLPGPRRLFMSG